jgi:[ribosomal protein S5]-alanine N-acetyltransferase
MFCIGITMVIHTPRTMLTTWSPEDWVAFRELATNPDVVRYISEGLPWPDERTQEFVTRQIRYYAERYYCLWKLVDRATGQLSGICGIQPFEDSGDIEIGWWLAPRLWGGGIATEAARAAFSDAVTRVGLKRIVACAVPENRASIRIMEKLGMHYERDGTHRGIPVVIYASESKSGEVLGG